MRFRKAFASTDIITAGIRTGVADSGSACTCLRVRDRTPEGKARPWHRRAAGRSSPSEAQHLLGQQRAKRNCGRSAYGCTLGLGATRRSAKRERPLLRAAVRKGHAVANAGRRSDSARSAINCRNTSSRSARPTSRSSISQPAAWHSASTRPKSPAHRSAAPAPSRRLSGAPYGRRTVPSTRKVICTPSLVTARTRVSIGSRCPIWHRNPLTHAALLQV